MSENRIRVIIKRPGEACFVQHVDNTLEALQEIVGGYIEAVNIGSNWAIICNEEGRLRGLPYNTNICGVDFVGPIIFLGTDGDEFCDLAISLEDFVEVFGKAVTE